MTSVTFYFLFPQVSLGTAPGASDIYKVVDINDDFIYTWTISALNLSDAKKLQDAQQIYVNLVAYNAELLTTKASTAFVWDNSAPVVSDLRILRTVDGVWSAYSCPTTNPDGFCNNPMTAIVLNGSAIQARFYLLEPTPDCEIDIVKYSIGTAPGATDIRNYTDIGRNLQRQDKSAEPYTIVAAGLPLTHNSKYWLNIYTRNSRYIEQVFNSIEIWTDYT